MEVVICIILLWNIINFQENIAGRDDPQHVSESDFLSLRQCQNSLLLDNFTTGQDIMSQAITKNGATRQLF